MDSHIQLLRKSVEIARAQGRLVPASRALSPFDVMRELNEVGVRFVLVGSYGMCGWRKQARSAGRTELVVGKSVVARAARSLTKAFSRLTSGTCGSDCLLHDRKTGRVAIRVIGAWSPPASEVMGNALWLATLSCEYRIPNAAMALVLTHSNMVSEHVEWADRYLAASDFIRVVNANDGLGETGLRNLSSKVSRSHAKDIIARVRRIRSGGKLGDLTLES